MLTWVIYDITEDKVRNRIAKYCQKAGLYRVQKSVFLGELEPNRRDELLELFQTLIDLETDSVYVSPLCNDDYKHILILGRDFDRQLVANETSQFFF